jgi:hypothetical protein
VKFRAHAIADISWNGPPPAAVISSNNRIEEAIMRKFVHAGALVFAGCIAFAAMAQDAIRGQGDRSSPPQDQVIGPPEAKVNARGEAAPHELPGASAETMPSTLSAENAAKDAHWWLDRTTALSDEQKRTIYRTLAGERKAGDQTADGSAAAKIYPEPSVELPVGTKVHELPEELKAQIPYIKNFKYLTADNKILLVDPDDWTVAAVVSE